MQTDETELAREPHVHPDWLSAFEKRLDVFHPEKVQGARIIGFGEISLVFALDEHPDLVFKRVAGFRADEVAGYERVVRAYVRTLQEHRVQVAPVTAIEVPSAGGRIVYLAQRRVDARTLGHRVLSEGSDDELRSLLEAVLARVRAVLSPEVGIDAQLSNWSVSPDGALTYLDLSTPLLRHGSEERLGLGFAMRSLPLPVRWTLELSGKKRSMLDRYYDRRRVAVDVVANFVKEGREDRLPLGVEVVNRWLGELGLAPVTIDEVRADYRDDARTWAFLQWIKRPDRFVRAKLLRTPYEWLLAPPIERHR